MTTGLGGAAAPQQARPDRDGDPAAAIALPDGSPAAVAAGLPPGNLVVLGGPGSGKTTLLEATMYDLAAAPTGAALFVTSSRQAAVASTARLLARVERAAGGALCCVTWHAFARGLVTSHADLLPYRGEPRPLSGPEQWSLVRELLLQDPPVVDWGDLEPLVRTRAFTDELASFVLACQRRLIGPEDLVERATAQRRPAWHLAADFLASYLGHLALAGMVVQAGDLLEDHPDLRADTVAQVGTVLVDEAQELDPAQFRLLELLAGDGARVIMAGDPAGSTGPTAVPPPGRCPSGRPSSAAGRSCWSTAAGWVGAAWTPSGGSSRPVRTRRWPSGAAAPPPSTPPTSPAPPKRPTRSPACYGSPITATACPTVAWPCCCPRRDA